MEPDYSNSEIEGAARRYLEEDRGSFDRWMHNVNSARRNRGEDTYSTEELWSYFEEVDTLEDTVEREILLSPDLGVEAASDYLDIDMDTAYMTIIENGEDIEDRSRHEDSEVTEMLDLFLQDWKDPREIAGSVEAGEKGVYSVLNRAGIEALDRESEITRQRVRLAEHKELDREEMDEFVFPNSDNPVPEKYTPGYMQKEKNVEKTKKFEVSVNMEDIEREEAAAWYMQNAETQDPAQLTTTLLKMGYEVEFGEEDRIIEKGLETEVSGKKLEHLNQEYSENLS